MYEDVAVELKAFPPGGRVFCIASAGSTAFTLAARGDRVTAVDLNPAQVDYVRGRMRGGPASDGVVERRHRRLRRLGPVLGWKRRDVERFCSFGDPDEQARFWRSRLDTRRFRVLLRTLLSPFTLRLAFDRELLDEVPSRLDQAIRRRLARGFATHPNRDNPYVRWFFLGEAAPVEPAPVKLVRADAAEFLESVPAASFDAFSLSNILDTAGDDYRRRLWAAVRRAAAPGAVAFLRSFDEPRNQEEDDWAARDRALVWGRIEVWRA
jgi:S-adenosylmethionine:diacylglycerol 3-amino-3-carboxypropyl transferase